MIYTDIVRTVNVDLPVNVAAALLTLEVGPNTGWANEIRAALGSSSEADEDTRQAEQTSESIDPPKRRYAVNVLGTRLTAWALPDMFCQLVDLFGDLDPEVLRTLSTKRARTRRYVAKSPEEVHFLRSDLPTMQTRSGWWISKNIGQRDLERGIRALADAAGLTYGKDISFGR